MQHDDSVIQTRAIRRPDRRVESRGCKSGLVRVKSQVASSPSCQIYNRARSTLSLTAFLSN
ncbi:hypothetical protein CBOM_07646 [Ceraceosorus bombacis]|uniref:Uncharacterized protein n=1 Tax=Ceraceosorus bombacis TaxID=401625 RepID=A0A0P1BAA9_9BASI|nr:hypothetical protein CBOM_07646 [Ceraceosorus bombacis]